MEWSAFLRAAGPQPSKVCRRSKSALTTRDEDWHGISPGILRVLDRMEKWPPASTAIVWTFSPRRPPAAGLQTQRQSLAPPVAEEPKLADPRSAMSGARFGHQEIPAHRDGQRPCLYR